MKTYVKLEINKNYPAHKIEKGDTVNVWYKNGKPHITKSIDDLEPDKITLCIHGKEYFIPKRYINL